MSLDKNKVDEKQRLAMTELYTTYRTAELQAMEKAGVPFSEYAALALFCDLLNAYAKLNVSPMKFSLAVAELVSEAIETIEKGEVIVEKIHKPS